MSVLHPDPAPHPIHRVHRGGVGALGGFLVIFGSMGLARAPEFLSTSGSMVMGLSTNGLLATISLVVGGVLVAAAVRGGPTASLVAVVVGTLFLVSGLGNALVLDTPMNMLAFQFSNVLFSVLVGAALLFLGAYGRFTGGLPASSPYAADGPRTPTAPAPAAPARLGDGSVERAMADAERAVAQRTATTEQLARVRAAAPFRTHEDRRRAFLAPAPSAPIAQTNGTFVA